MKAIFVGVLAAIVSAMGATAQIGSEGGPIEVRADRTEYYDTQGLSRWIGDVEVHQGDSTLYAEQVDIFFTPSEGDAATAQRSILRIEALGEVAYIRPNETARADKGIYFADTGLLHLVGTVSLKRARDTITGDNLIYDPANGQIVVDQGEDERVRAQFETNTITSPSPDR